MGHDDTVQQIVQRKYDSNHTQSQNPVDPMHHFANICANIRSLQSYLVYTNLLMFLDYLVRQKCACRALVHCARRDVAASAKEQTTLATEYAIARKQRRQS